MDTAWRIELFGGLRAHQGDRVVAHFPTQKTGLLPAYLAYYHQHPHPREVLIDQLCPDADPDAARASLRVALSALRRLLEPGGIAAGTLLVASRSAISLDLGAFTTDVTEFRTALRAAARTDSATERAALLARAIERYRGELLPGHYDAWVLTERQHLAEEHLAALHQLGTALEQSGELQQAVEVARQAVVADPLREEAHYNLMRLYVAAGQPSAVLRRYQELERLLREELGETPSAGTRALSDELRQRAHQVAHRRATVSRRGDGATGRRGDPMGDRSSRPLAPSPRLVPSPRSRRGRRSDTISPCSSPASSGGCRRWHGCGSSWTAPGS